MPSWGAWSTVLRTYLPLGEWYHMVEVNIQWWRYARAPNTMVKWATKAARGQDQHLKYAYALARANEMADSWSSSFDANSAALRRGFDKKHVFVHTFAVLRRFIVLGWFATVWKTQTGHTHTLQTTVTLQCMHAEGEWLRRVIDSYIMLPGQPGNIWSVIKLISNAGTGDTWFITTYHHLT